MNLIIISGSLIIRNWKYEATRCSKTVLGFEVFEDDLVGDLLLLGEEADVHQHVRVLTKHSVRGQLQAVAELGQQVYLEFFVGRLGFRGEDQLYELLQALETA